MPQRLVLLHTGKRPDKGPFDKAHSELPPFTKGPLGCLLGVIILEGPYKREDHTETETSPYVNGNYYYKIIKHVCLTKPIPSKGQLGLYKVQGEETLHQILKDENIIKHIQSINDMLSRIHPTISNHWTMENLRCISIKQPHAGWILHNGKDIENRSTKISNLSWKLQ